MKEKDENELIDGPTLKPPEGRTPFIVQDHCVNQSLKLRFIEEESYREEEMKILRRDMFFKFKYNKPTALETSKEMMELALSYFLDMYSSEILRKFLSHSIAYYYCLEKAIRQIEKAKKQMNWVCQECGNWELKGVQMSMAGTCVSCFKQDVETFPDG